MALEDFLARLDPKTANRVKTAAENELIRLPMASYGMTKALGGGVAKGRISLFYGNQSAGKTLQLQQAVALWQKMGLICAWVDVEDAWDKEWAERLGVDNNELILIKAKSSAKIEEEIAPLIQNKIDVIVIDSISDIMPEVFVGADGSLNAQTDRKQIGAQAKAITALVSGILYLNEETAICLISQTTTQFEQWGVVQVPHGGKKVLFASSQIIRLTSSNSDGNQIKGDNYIGDLVIQENIGRTVKGIVEKNKLGKQGGTFEYDMYYAGKNVGIDNIGEIIKTAIKYNIIVKPAKSAWHEFEGKKWQGQEKTTNYFRENPDQLQYLKAVIEQVEAGEVKDESLVTA